MQWSAKSRAPTDARRYVTVIMHISHEEYIKKQRQKVVDLLRDVIDGKTSILVASRQIVQLRFEIDFDENDKDILAFVGIDSESDSLPIGLERAYWSEEALKNKENEIMEIEKWALDFGIEACKNLMEKLTMETT
ncbi:MAG: DUF2489 domain-containing protein [Candidatus Thiodiazotropha sp.]